MTDQATQIDALLTPEVRSVIGRTSLPIPLPEEISASDVRRYIAATDDRNPLWLDDEFARRAGYRSRIVPPMLVIELNWRVRDAEGGRPWHYDIPLPENYSDARNAETEIEWLGEVYIGETLSLVHRVSDIAVRPGRRGLGIYITRETEFRAGDGRLVARQCQTVVRFPKTAIGANN